MHPHTPSPTEAFRAARDLLLAHGDDLDAAHRGFRWPRPATFNWALDWFDAVAAHRAGPALRLARPGHPDGDVTVSWQTLSRRSAQVANWLRGQGLRRGDPVMLLLDNRVPVWETMLAAIKLGAVLIPTYTTATPAELADRAARGGVRFVVAEAALAGGFGPGPHPWRGVAVGGPTPPGWTSYEDSRSTPQEFVPDGPTGADDPLFRYFTSGTTSAPKMVEHTHTSYPVGLPVRDVLERGAPGGRAPERLGAGLGQALLELVLRPLERGGHGPRPALHDGRRRRGGTGGAAHPRCDHLLRPAHHLAGDGLGGAGGAPGGAAGGRGGG